MYPAAPLPHPRQRRGKGCPLTSHFTKGPSVTGEQVQRRRERILHMCIFLCYQELEVSGVAQIHIHPESWKETLFENGVLA